MKFTLKLFFTFWITALLLAGAVFLAERFYGGDVLKEVERTLQAQAEALSSLWNSGDRRAVEHWLAKPPPFKRLLLLDADLNSPFPTPRGMLIREHLPTPLKAGHFHLPRGHVALVVAVPGIEQPLFLVRILDRGRHFLLPIWARILIAVLVVGLVSVGMAVILTRRMRRLRRAVQAFAEGELDTRVQIKGCDEVTGLAEDFNMMAERLQVLIHSQRGMVSAVSHELRSPLARLRVALELAEKESDREKALGRIAKEADELEHLISELLSLSQLEMGKRMKPFQPVQLDVLVAGIVEDAEFETAATDRHIVLTVSEAATVNGDAVWLRAAIENVVRNAIRYTPEQGSVFVEVARFGERARVSVSDEGSGVPEADLKSLFEPFTRVGEARDRKSGGYGLGLAISGRVLALHDGNIVAQNREQGGLQVVMTLPLLKAEE